MQVLSTQAVTITNKSYLALSGYIVIPLTGDKVSLLTHTYTHKPLRNIIVTICNHQVDSPLYVWPDVWSDDLQV